MSSESSTISQSENWPMYFTGIAALSLCVFDVPVHGPAALFLVAAFAAMFATPFWLVFADVFWFYRFIAGWVLFFSIFPLIMLNVGIVYVGAVIFFLIVIYRLIALLGFEIYRLNDFINPANDPNNRNLDHQFSIKDLFFVMIVVGVSAGLIRLGLRAWPISWSDVFKTWTIITVWITIVGNLFALYGMLHVRFSPWRMIAGATLAVPWLFLQTGTIDYWKVISFALGYTICLFFFAILRSNGYRWAWNGL